VSSVPVVAGRSSYMFMSIEAQGAPQAIGALRGELSRLRTGSRDQRYREDLDRLLLRLEFFGPGRVGDNFKYYTPVVVQGNDTTMALAAAILVPRTSSRLTIARKLKVRTVWINTYGQIAQSPFRRLQAIGFSAANAGRYAIESSHPDQSVYAISRAARSIQ